MAELQVVVLAGGVGAARFLGGLVETKGNDSDITVISNTADDIRLFGLQVCPDLDSVMYGLGGVESSDRGWGRENETFNTLEELRAYKAEPEWFQLGDRDIATHLIRTQMLDAGYSLSQVTQALCKRWEIPATLIPMTNERVETHVVVDDPETDHVKAIHFQEWWVRYRASLPAREFLTIGADVAKPAPGVLGAIGSADVIILPPSNPVVSINPILNVPGIRQALRLANAPIVGVSPIIGGEVVRGMADKCLAAINVAATASGIAAYYGPRSGDGLLDAWIVDELDETSVKEISQLGIKTVATKTLMSEPGVSKKLAETVLELANQVTKAKDA
ncbi:MAG: 2-phospho-L-lactate transferase [Candidatus Nanopelagicales bacterium]